MNTKSNEIKGIDWHYNGKRLTFLKPMVMAIVNITPDSFYDGNKFGSVNDVLHDMEEKLCQGAAILDIGAASSRPGADEISESEEWKRLEPVLTACRKEFPEAIISIDTYRSQIAKKSSELGADMINDISGGLLDDQMFEVIASLGIPYILMHMKGHPKTMQHQPEYEHVVDEVNQHFSNGIATLKNLGHDKVILDPGFGFGKDLHHNYQLLKNTDNFHTHAKPLLAGLSRKSMINKVIGTNPVTALNGTTVLNTIALINGYSILRVHDVTEAKQAIELVQYYKNQ